MRIVHTTPRFERKLRGFLKKHAALGDAVRHMMRIVTDGPTDALRIHKLKGVLRECHAARISYEYRVVFILTDEAVTFIDIGTHDDVY